MASKFKRPANRYRVTYYPARKPGGLVAGNANTLEKARQLAGNRKPATIWDDWHCETDDRGRRFYSPIFVEAVV